MRVNVTCKIRKEIHEQFRFNLLFFADWPPSFYKNFAQVVSIGCLNSLVFGLTEKGWLTISLTRRGISVWFCTNWWDFSYSLLSNALANTEHEWETNPKLMSILNFTIILFSGPLKVTLVRDDYFLFGSVFIKKNNQTEIFFKKNWNQTETGSNRPVSVRFSFLGKKPVQTGFGSIFSGLARFARFFRFGSVWLVFFYFFSVSVRFGFFSFLLIKLKPNRTGRFFQNFNRFFFSVRFFRLFFSGFLGLISFLIFLLTPNSYKVCGRESFSCLYIWIRSSQYYSKKWKL